MHRLPWLANELGPGRDAGRTLSRAVFAGCVGQARAEGIDLSQ